MTYLKFVGKTSVIKQSNAALPHDITELNTADTTKLCNLFLMKYILAAHSPDENVLNTENLILSFIYYQNISKRVFEELVLNDKAASTLND